MELSFYEALINESNNPYIHCKLIYDVYDKPKDFRILAANQSFEKMCGLDKSNILNCLGSVVVPDISLDQEKWLKLFQEVTHNIKRNRINTSAFIQNRDFNITIIGDVNDEFVVLFEDFLGNREYHEDLKKMILYSQEFLQYTGTDIDYQKIVDDFMQLCFGKFAVFNLFDEEGRNFKTKAISCEGRLMSKVNKMIGFSLKDKQWTYDPVYLSKIEKSKIVYFECLQDIVGDVLPKTIVKLIGTTFNIGEVVVMKIMHFERILGEFTIFMEKGSHFQREYLADLYTNHVGLFLTRLESDAKRTKEKQFLETTLLSISDGVISTNHKGEILLINKVAQRLTGFSTEEAIGQLVEEVFFIKDELSELTLEDLIDQVLADKIVIQRLEHVTLTSKEGIVRSIEATVSPIIDNKEQLLGTVLVFSDITEKKIQQDRIGYLSFHDQLTGLYNRRYYEEELMRIDQSRNLPISLILGDVNGLKLINDSFGHQMGDKLLIKIAQIIKINSRADDIIARLGGDEFVVILPKTNTVEAEEMIHRIRNNTESETINGVTLSISFGSATKTHNEQNIQAVFKTAEDIMYTRKLYEGARIKSKAIELIMSGLFNKNPMEMKHCERVSLMCKELAIKLDFNEEAINQIAEAGLMHDIGKTGIKDTILDKKGKLSEEEWQKVKRHSEIGYRILSSVNEFADIANFILEHHEKVDGSGYPKGLKGNELTVQGKIIAIVDAFDAMTSQKKYGRTLTVDEAINEIIINANKQFDGEISRVFIEEVLKKTWYEIK